MPGFTPPAPLHAPVTRVSDLTAALLHSLGACFVLVNAAVWIASSYPLHHGCIILFFICISTFCLLHAVGELCLWVLCAITQARRKDSEFSIRVAACFVLCLGRSAVRESWQGRSLKKHCTFNKRIRYLVHLRYVALCFKLHIEVINHNYNIKMRFVVWFAPHETFVSIVSTSPS